jgi:hypothetical protein
MLIYFFSKFSRRQSKSRQKKKKKKKIVKNMARRSTGPETTLAKKQFAVAD